MIKLIKAEVKALKAQRQARDIWVAAQLWDWFEKEQRVGMMQCIRTLVGHGLDYLYELKWEDLGGMSKFLSAECRGLDIWEGKTPSYMAFNRLRDKGANWWDIGKCGGFFRMYGTFFEFFGKKEKKKADGTWSTKSGETYHEGVDSFKTHTANGAQTGLPFGKYQPQKKRKGEDARTPEQQYRKDHPRARGRGASPGQLPKAVQGLVHKPYGDDPGITLFKLLEWSTIKKIDNFFGLPEGADISGTTSDHLFGIYHTLFLMEQGRPAPRSIKFSGGSYPADLQQINERKPLIILLPLAQMVREYHHALLETAAALSLNDMTDYKIGFYSSLIALDYVRSYDRQGKLGMKVVPWRPTNLPLANTVRKLLNEADKAVPHMLCCSYTEETPDTKVVGYLLDKTNAEETKKFRTLARLGVETYNKFYSLPKKIKMKDVESMMRRAGLDF